MDATLMIGIFLLTPILFAFLTTKLENVTLQLFFLFITIIFILIAPTILNGVLTDESIVLPVLSSGITSTYTLLVIVAVFTTFYIMVYAIWKVLTFANLKKRAAYENSNN
jgi:hypothetical protein